MTIDILNTNFMALEIERRFLVKGEEWKAIAKNRHALRQGYLVNNIQGWIVRMRIVDQKKAWLTLKTKAEGIANHEFEYMIPLKDAESLLEFAPHKIIKTRYELNFEGGEWVIDCFEDNNSPLVIAEVELASSEDQIHIPTWCYQEITSNKQLSNAALAKDPISNWSNEKRLATNLLL